MFASNNENSIQNSTDSHITYDSTKPIENMQAIHIHGNNRQASALERPKTSMARIK
jgi:hypothetical protein